MAQIEVEHRGLLTKEKFKELQNFFSKEGQFIDEKRRFSFIYNSSEKSVREVKDDLLDIKLRITNKKPELAVKYGKWSGKDARKEFNFFLGENQFDDMLGLLEILGYKKFVLMANTKYDYAYHGVEFSLVEVPEWGYYFEAEICVPEGKQDEAIKKIDQEIEKLGLKVVNAEEFYNLLDELNNRDGFRVTLTENTLPEVRKRFAEYF